MEGPLSGIRVIDLSTMLSGPMATMILGDQGADIIKVEQPGTGDHVRSLADQRGGMSSMFLNLNRNKRSLTLALKTAAGRAVLLELLRGADILVQNFRPGVVERLRIDEASVRAVAPRLIYASISGFGETGPWVHKPVYDPIIQAMSGLTTIQAGSDTARPRLVRTVVPDKVTALYAAQAMTAALVERARTGVGQHIRLSMLDSVMAFLWASDMGAHTYLDGASPGEARGSFIDLIYQTADGYMTVAVMSDREWAGLTRALERPDWLQDQRFATAALRDRHVEERLRMTQAVLLERSTAAWMERLEAEDVPCAPALTRAEALLHPQLAASEALVVTAHPTAGRLRQAHAPARFGGRRSAVRRGAPPLGADTREIMREAGFSESAIDALAEQGAFSAGPTPDRGFPMAAE